MNSSQLAIRNIPDELSSALEREARRRGTSLNQTVIDLLKQSLAIREMRRNDLGSLAGTWSETDHREFLAAIEPLNEIDQEFWN